MEPNLCIAGIQYLPSVEYFVHWMHHRGIVLEYHEHYQKRTWRNKTAIISSTLPLFLTIPLRKGKNHEMPINLVEISYDEPWHKQHMGSLKSAYGKTAFFDEIENNLVSIYFSQPQFLWDLNLQILQSIIAFFPGEWMIKYTKCYEETLTAGLDLRKGIPAGEASISSELVPFYEQLHRFNKSHLPNLSILDVLCHLGPDTIYYLKEYENRLYS
jgi:hypothetical protein